MKGVLIKDDFAQVFDNDGKVIAAKENRPPTDEQMNCQARVALHNGPCNFGFCPGGASVVHWKTPKEPEKPALTPAQDRLQAKAKARTLINEVRANLRAQKGKEPEAAIAAALRRVLA